MQQNSKKYDYLFLSGSPSFYKTNLFNEIGRSAKVLVLYSGYCSDAVNSTNEQLKDCTFEYIFLYKNNIIKRNRIFILLKLINLIKSISYRYIIHEGWYVPEYCLCAFLVPKHKNATVCESTIFESETSGFKYLIKKLIINRSQIALPSGTPHKAIFDKMGYKGKIKITCGVGIINKQGERVMKKKSNIPLRYLYVGRLIDCKNLIFLIERFNENGKPLTIVGIGEMEAELKANSRENISFCGFIENDKLPEIYLSHDLLILPSKRETWGLVVEEAIYYGLPVIVSNHVGCSTEMVKNPKTGIIFELGNIDSFCHAILEMEANYEKYKTNTILYDFDTKDQKQVEAYLSI